LKNIIQRTRDGGAEILNLKKISTAYDSPGAAITTMVESMVYDSNRILPCITMLEGEYGESDIAIGVPVVLGGTGMKKVIELDLQKGEKADFDESVDSIRRTIANIKE
jgi:malate dehydrogenase